jgi:hypothetical protein
MEAGSREKLYRARDQLRDFVNSIGTDKFLPLR